MKRFDDAGSATLPVTSVAAPRALPVDHTPVPRVIVGVYRTVLEAELVRGRLEADGIDAQLTDAHTVGMAQHLSLLVGGVKLHVSEPDVEHARAVLTGGALWPAEPADDADNDKDDADHGVARVGTRPVVIAVSVVVGFIAMLAVAWPR
jgi:Putative prokaryotic signal transducing protein